MAKKTASKASAAKKPMTKSQILAQIADDTGLAKKEVAAVFDSLSGVVSKQLKPRGPEAITIPGLCKIVVKKTKAVKAGERVNPFTGEKKWYPAKPAKRVPRVRPLKALKDMV
jgi:nucleoid DNA-binding protein